MNKIIQLSAPFTGITSRYKQYYDIAKESHFWIEWRFQVFQQQFRFMKEAKNLPLKGLDAGCGNGVVRRQIENITSWTVDGADLIEEGLKRNHTTRGQTFLYDIQECHPSLKEAYDVIVLFDVIEHIKETTPFLDSVLYHLKPQGWLFVNVPAVNILFSRYDSVQSHYRRYNKSMMRKELSYHALEILDMRYWGFSLLPFTLIRKLRPYLRTSDEEILKKGFIPPRAWMNAWLLKLMQIETSYLKNPILGSSLMTTIRKL